MTHADAELVWWGMLSDEAGRLVWHLSQSGGQPEAKLIAVGYSRLVLGALREDVLLPLPVTDDHKHSCHCWSLSGGAQAPPRHVYHAPAKWP